MIMKPTKEDFEKRMYTSAYYLLTENENSLKNIAKITGYSEHIVSRGIEEYIATKQNLFELARQCKNLESFLRINLNK